MTHQSLSQQLKANLESLTRQEQDVEYEQWEVQKQMRGLADLRQELLSEKQKQEEVLLDSLWDE